MGTLNNELTMYRSASKMTNDEEEKRRQKIRNNVAKKLNLGNKPKKETPPEWTKQKPGSVANVNSSDQVRTSKQITDIDKKNRPQGDNTKPILTEKTKTTPSNKTNVLGNIPLTGRKIVGNVTEMMSEKDLEVKNKKYKSQTNTILGR